MEICFAMPSYTIGVLNSGRGWRQHARIYPIFSEDGADMTVNHSRISTTDSGWTMHGSQQNHCNHVKCHGTCYCFDAEPTSQWQYPDLPLWTYSYKSPKGSSYTRTINYIAPKYTGIVPLKHDVGQNSWGNTVSFTLCAIQIVLPVGNGEYAVAWGLDTYRDSDGTHPAGFQLNGQGGTGRTKCDVIILEGEKRSTRRVATVYCDTELNAHDMTYTASVDMSTYSPESHTLVDAADYTFDLTVISPSTDDSMIFEPYKAFGITYDSEDALSKGLSQVNFFDSNGMAFVRDLSKIKSSLTSDLSSLKQLAKVDKSGKVKIASQLFLSVHYGYRLLAADGFELAEQLAEYDRKYTLHIGQSMMPNVERSKVGDREIRSCSGHLNVYYEPYGQISSDVLALAEALDLVPDFSNVWDSIPFSFVVDWFTNIGDLAQKCDDWFTLTQQHKVLGSIESRKISYRYQPEQFFGDLIFERYQRMCYKDWYPIPNFSFQLKNPVTNIYHWLEGSALVVSNKS